MCVCVFGIQPLKFPRGGDDDDDLSALQLTDENLKKQTRVRDEIHPDEVCLSCANLLEEETYCTGCLGVSVTDRFPGKMSNPLSLVNSHTLQESGLWFGCSHRSWFVGHYELIRIHTQPIDLSFSELPVHGLN